MAMGAASGYLTRPQIRALKQRVQQLRDADAAIQLLADSVRKGHDTFALHRSCLALILDEACGNRFAPCCARVAASLPPVELERIVDHVSREAAMGLGITGGGRERI